MLNILETLDPVFDKVYSVYYDSNIVKFNVLLSSYVKNSNYTFTVIKFKQVMIGFIIDNLDSNVLLSNGSRCKIEHVVCKCSSYSKTKYDCVCKNINLKDQKCYHYYYLNFTSLD